MFEYQIRVGGLSGVSEDNVSTGCIKSPLNQANCRMFGFRDRLSVKHSATRAGKPVKNCVERRLTG